MERTRNLLLLLANCFVYALVLNTTFWVLKVEFEEKKPKHFIKQNKLV